MQNIYNLNNVRTYTQYNTLYYYSNSSEVETKLDRVKRRHHTGLTVRERTKKGGRKTCLLNYQLVERLAVMDVSKINLLLCIYIIQKSLLRVVVCNAYIIFYIYICF